MYRKTPIVIAGCLIVMVACSEPESPASEPARLNPVSGIAEKSAPSTRSAASLEPSEPALAALYNRSCRSCHAQGAAGAPLTGDTKAWESRLSQGIEVLLEHTRNGYQAMPPRGMCMDCTDQQFRGLIEFMSSGEG